MEISQNRLMKKVIWVLLALLFLLVFATALLSYQIFTNSLKYELTNTNRQLLKQIDHKLELTLTAIDRATIRLIQSEEVRKFFDPGNTEQEANENAYRVNNQFTRFINTDDYVLSVDMYSYGQRRLVSGNVLTETNLIDDYQWITQFEQYDGYANWMTTRRLPINSSNYSIYRNVVTLVRTYPLIHSPGSRRGAIAVNIKEDALFALLGNAANAELGNNFIIDNQGRVVLHSDKSKLGRDFSELPYIADIVRGGVEGQFQSSVAEKDSSVFYVSSKYTGWKIVRVVPEMQLNKPLVSLRNTMVVIAAILFAAAAALAVAVGRWTFRPFNRFIQSMSKKMKTYPLDGADRKYADEFVYFESMVQHLLNDTEQLHKQTMESKPVLKWRLLTELLSNYRINFNNVAPYMEMLGIQLFPNRFIVMSVDFDNKADIVNPRDTHLYAYALCNVAEELMNAEGRGTAVELEYGRCAIIMSFEEDEAEKLVIRAVAVADLLKNFAEEYLKRTITVGIGGVVQSLQEIHVSFKQSHEALKYKLIMGNNTIITADDIHGYHSAEFHRLFAMTDSIIDAMKLLDGEKMRRQTDRWFHAFTLHNVPPDMIRQLNVQCLMKAATVAGEIGVAPEELTPSQNLYETLNQYERLDQVKRFLTAALEDFIVKIKAKRSSREKNETIDRALRYIRDHYMRSDLSLNLLADEFRISVSHLSRMFKEYTSCNFIDYLMEIRINKSKELLAETSGKIRDIAEAVGYTNVNSFVRIFKKMTGLTPGEYRDAKWSKRQQSALNHEDDVKRLSAPGE